MRRDVKKLRHLTEEWRVKYVTPVDAFEWQDKERILRAFVDHMTAILL